MSNNSDWQKHLDHLDEHYHPNVFFAGKNPRPSNDPSIENNFFTPSLTDEAEFPAEGQLTVDISQDEKNLYVVAPIAGVKAGDLEVGIDNDVLTIRGRRDQKYEEKGKNFIYRECHWGRFSRSIVLPLPVKTKAIEAKLENGVLKITLPKAEENKKMNIPIHELLE